MAILKYSTKSTILAIKYFGLTFFKIFKKFQNTSEEMLERGSSVYEIYIFILSQIVSHVYYSLHFVAKLQNSCKILYSRL